MAGQPGYLATASKLREVRVVIRDSSGLTAMTSIPDSRVYDNVFDIDLDTTKPVESSYGGLNWQNKKLTFSTNSSSQYTISFSSVSTITDVGGLVAVDDISMYRYVPSTPTPTPTVTNTPVTPTPTPTVTKTPVTPTPTPTITLTPSITRPISKILNSQVNVGDSACGVVGDKRLIFNIYTNGAVGAILPGRSVSTLQLNLTDWCAVGSKSNRIPLASEISLTSVYLRFMGFNGGQSFDFNIAGTFTYSSNTNSFTWNFTNNNVNSNGITSVSVDVTFDFDKLEYFANTTGINPTIIGIWNQKSLSIPAITNYTINII
jgi:hypothetical protein